MKNDQLPASTALPTELLVPGAASALEVNISTDLASVEVRHNGRKVKIMRNQDQSNTVNPEFAKTSRKCSPFCIQPSELAPGVKTIAELEVLHFLKKISDGDASTMVIDSRTRAWVEKGHYSRNGEHPMGHTQHRQVGSGCRAGNSGTPTWCEETR